MFRALKPGFRSLATLKLVANFKPKRTAAVSRGFLATTRLSCLFLISTRGRPSSTRGNPIIHVRAISSAQLPVLVQSINQSNKQTINQSINQKLFLTRAASCTELESEAQFSAIQGELKVN